MANKITLRVSKWLKRYFGIETITYKEWWVKNSMEIQILIDKELGGK